MSKLVTKMTVEAAKKHGINIADFEIFDASYRSTIKSEPKEYIPSYTAQERKEFWLHNLNPITGMPAVKEKLEDSPQIAIDTSATICARVNGGLVY